MNINTDNYEAYLLDYMEGGLSPDETKQLKAFVTAQGLDWNELTEELPHLEAPSLVYEDKDSLKKKAVFVPLFAKIVAAAAAIGLLCVLFWKPKETLPQQELMAELQPIEAASLDTGEADFPAPKERPYLIKKQQITEKKLPVSRLEGKGETPLLADMQPISTQEIRLTDNYLIANNLLPEPLLYHFDPEVAFIEEAYFYEDDWEPSLLDKGVIWLTKGQYSSVGELVGGALHRVSHEMVTTTTKIAMTAYYNADSQFEEIKEHWQEKRELRSGE